MKRKQLKLIDHLSIIRGWAKREMELIQERYMVAGMGEPAITQAQITLCVRLLHSLEHIVDLTLMIDPMPLIPDERPTEPDLLKGKSEPPPDKD